jgi:hypothetical protein
VVLSLSKKNKKETRKKRVRENNVTIVGDMKACGQNENPYSGCYTVLLRPVRSKQSPDAIQMFRHSIFSKDYTAYLTWDLMECITSNNNSC